MILEIKLKKGRSTEGMSSVVGNPGMITKIRGGGILFPLRQKEKRENVKIQSQN
jgi:hypothetical protein